LATNDIYHKQRTQAAIPAPCAAYYVFDNASVKVTEVRSQHQSAWIKEGFNSMSVGGSLEVGHAVCSLTALTGASFTGGGQETVPVSVDASWEQEHAYSS
jgi:hypothetical protein